MQNLKCVSSVWEGYNYIFFLKWHNLSAFAAISSDGREVFLRDIWPTREEIQREERKFVIPSMFREVYEKIEVRRHSVSKAFVNADF